MDSPNTDFIPRPDPTKLTTEQLYREVAQLKENLENRLNCAEEHTESTCKLLDTKINALKELHNAALHDTQENVKILTQVLQLAINKSENFVEKQFDAVNKNMATQNKANADRIDDIKERLDRGEGSKQGRTETVKNTQNNTHLILILLGTIIAFFSLAIGGIALFIATYHKV